MGTLISRGQIAIGRKSLSQSLGITEMMVRSRLEKLIETKEITIKTTNHFSIITICNYEKYQNKQPSKQPTDNQPITNQQPTDNQPITTIEEVIEVKKVKERKEQTTVSDSILFEKIKKYFGFESESKFLTRWHDIQYFLNTLKEKEATDNFRTQFHFYKTYKAEAKEKIHSFDSFISGGWEAENWEKKYNDFKKNNSTSIESLKENYKPITFSK